MVVAVSSVIGIIGNIISVLVFTSPIKTFWGIVKKKSTENYSELPYITTLLSTSLWTFYGIIKPGGLLIATVNGAGVVLQLIYTTLFFIYAPKEKKVKIGKLIAVLNIAFLGSVIALTQLAIIPEKKISFVGIICSVLTIIMYASPLSAMSMVIKMKSVEYMPFLLSFFLFLNGGIWAIYAVIVKDIFVAVPNAMGFLLGSAQLVLYFMYKNKSKKSTEAMEEEGSVNLVTGREFEIKSNGNYDVEAGLRNTSLSKGQSLPKPLVNRMYAVPTKIAKTASLSSYDLDAAWAIAAGDVEKGLRKNRPEKF